MYWEETTQDGDNVVPDDVIDLVFGITCRSLPVDHAYSLSQAIHNVLPWFADEPVAGMHTIHVAESGNGWIRPDGPDAMLHPSRRTKLTLRLPKHRIEDAETLIGQELDIDGHALTVNKASIRTLSAITTIFSRYIVANDTESETHFMEQTIERLKALNIRPKKLLCGIERLIHTPDGDIKTRSLMLADLRFDESVMLQQVGMGGFRNMGCGIFIPHKDINQISEDLG